MQISPAKRASVYRPRPGRPLSERRRSRKVGFSANSTCTCRKPGYRQLRAVGRSPMAILPLTPFSVHLRSNSRDALLSSADHSRGDGGRKVIRRGKRWWDLPQTNLLSAPDSFVTIRAWRECEQSAGRPSGLLDYYRAHGFCVACKASGIRLSPVDWDGDVPLYEQCEICGGTGKVEAS